MVEMMIAKEAKDIKKEFIKSCGNDKLKYLIKKKRKKEVGIVLRGLIKVLLVPESFYSRKYKTTNRCTFRFRIERVSKTSPSSVKS